MSEVEYGEMRPHTERCRGLFISRCPSLSLEMRKKGDQNEGEISTGCPGEEERGVLDRTQERIGEDTGDNWNSPRELLELLHTLNSTKNIVILLIIPRIFAL